MRFLLLFSMLVGCQSEKEIMATIWRGGNHEIVRDLENNQEEYLPTDDAKFLEFRCMQKDDAEKLVREALKNCDQNFEFLSY